MFVKRRTWTPEEDHSLIELCAEGLSYPEIGRRLTRSAGSINARCGFLGVANNRLPGPQRGSLSAKRERTQAGSIAMEIGAAAEYLVCADLWMQHYRAFLSSAGLPYDVVLEVGGRLLRVAVKGVLQSSVRIMEGNRVCYPFNLQRTRSGPRRLVRRYTTEECDLVAGAALDIKRVIYIPPTNGSWSTAFHVDPPNTPSSMYARKRWEEWSLSQALIDLGVLPGTPSKRPSKRPTAYADRQ